MSFTDQLKQALKDFHTPEKLAAENALASAYFLSSALPTHGQKLSWAELLRRELLAAADSLWGAPPPANRQQIESSQDAILQQPGTGPYHYLLLELRYFKRFFHPRSLSQIWTDFTRQSRAEFYRDLNDATTALADALLSRLQPSVRSDTPPPSQPLFGREALLAECSQLLRTGGALALHGPGGIGKSSLGGALAHGWQRGPVFWYTVRPELSDGLHHLLYALAWFFQSHGQPRLWRLLAAQAGEASDLNLLYHQSRTDCAGLENPLLCFDDVDLWPDAKSTVWQMLAGLEESANLLYIGQRLPTLAQSHRQVAPLSSDAGLALLRSADVEAERDEVAEIHRQAGGNPRLLWLAADLMRRESAAALTVSSDLLLQSYFLHLWPRLRSEEQSLLQALSVYHTPAPADTFDQKLLLDLAARHLLLNDGKGGVSLLPALAEAVTRNLTADLRTELHAQAAANYHSRAEFTLAAWHLQQANQPVAAVQLWFPQRAREIRRGQADAARAIFQAMEPDNLPNKEQKALRLLRAELARLSGASQAGVDDLAIAWPTGDPLSLRAHQLRGDFLDALGQPEAAQRSYQDGLTIAAGLVRTATELHSQRAKAYVRQRNLTEAWHEARLARYTTEQIYGMVTEARGELDAALAHYRTALALAEEVDSPANQAESLRCLSKVHGMRGDLEGSVAFAQEAIAIYDRMGDLVSGARVRSNLAANYLDARRYAEVIETGAPALDFFQTTQHPHGIAATASNLAEAHFELGDYSQATEYAELALAQEEPLAAPYALFTLGLIAQATDKPAQAEATLYRCIAVGEENDDRFIQAHAWLKLAQILPAGDEEVRHAAAEAARLFDGLGIPALAAEARQIGAQEIAQRSAIGK